MSDRTYIHTYPYRGFTVGTYTENGKPVGAFGDVPVFARYYVLDEFEQNVMPLDQWFWTAVHAFAAIDAICIANPTCDKTKWGGVYARQAEHLRLSRFLPATHAALDALRTSLEDWTFNSGEDCQAEVQKILGPFYAELSKVGPVPGEML